MCLCLCMALPGMAWSQKKITIKNFYLEENDLDAKTGYPKLDPVNGEVCAIIKLQSGEDGFKFDLGSLVPAAVEKKTGETWIYVPPKARHIRILHNLLGNSDQYDFGIPIESGRVYIMNILTDGTGQGIFIQQADATGRFVEFFVTPATATLEIGGNLLTLENGYATKFMEFGQFEYLATAQNYHNLPGKLTVDRSSSENIRLRINLRPNFGFLVLQSDDEYKDAQVFIDNRSVGKLPFKSNEIPSGQHQLRIAKNMYKTYQQNIVIEDGQTLTLTPQLIANFARTTLIVDADADIYVNGQKKGTRKWSGALEVGNYKVECRQENHETVSQNISILDNKESRTFTLKAPVPIEGGLRITSNVQQGEVYIDGQKVGTTPYYNPRMLIGKHKVSIQKSGYGTAEETVEVVKGQTVDKDFKLTSSLSIRILSNPSEASVSIDGVNRGHTPLELQLNAGSHTIKLVKDGYYTEEKTENFNASKSYHYTLSSNLAEVRVETNKWGSLYVDGSYKGSLPATVNLKHGTHTFEGRNYSNYLGKKTVMVDGSTKKVFIDMKRDMVKKYSFYIEPMYRIGNLSAFGGNIGCFINKLNIEGSFYLPICDEQQISWYYKNPPSGSNGLMCVNSYKPKMEYGGKAGYSFKLSRWCRLTPQAGARMILIDEDKQDGYTHITDDMYVLAATVSLRASLMLAQGIAITIVPEYQMRVKETEGYKVLKDISPEMKKWGEGFNCFAGVTFYL